MPYTWNYVIEKESLKFKALEHVLIEKADQLFGTCSSHSLFFSPPAIQQELDYTIRPTAAMGQSARFTAFTPEVTSRLKG